MPTMTVRLLEGNRLIPFTPGKSLRELLAQACLPVRVGCNGSGACGLCRIRVFGGDPGAPTLAEEIHLSHQLAAGMRLACQLIPESDLEIEVLSPAPLALWRCLDDFPPQGPDPGVQHSPPQQPPLGVAIDLGTTHLSLTLLDLVSGRRLAGRRGLNPQGATGADIITRLEAAREGQAEALRSLVIRAMKEGMRDLASGTGVAPGRIRQVVLVGNTAMIALLSGNHISELLLPDSWSRKVDWPPEAAGTSNWMREIAPNAELEIIPPLAGMVGSDLLAGIVGLRLTEQEPGSLLIDFGTNTELALWDGHSIGVTSAAGGPAFEGSGIGCAIPADQGAICSVQTRDGSGKLHFRVIDGVPPEGVCGTGMVDLVACLLRDGTLNRRGKFEPPHHAAGFRLEGPGSRLLVTGRDIDLFQRAKAAIGVASQVLLERAGLGFRDLRRIYLGGIFGRHLDVRNAQLLGLIPPLDPGRVKSCGNTALLGAEALLLNPPSRETLRQAVQGSTLVSLSSYDNFADLFMENLYLQPLAESPGKPA
jgi:uncharacterized 2Fe-2S/4Fe-4S cluster protein (DUF4445 family)